MQNRKRKPLKIDDSYTVVAQLFKVSNSYVRKIVADTRHIRHKNERTIAIRQAYLAYKHGKQELIKKIESNLTPAA
jgi:hypothetical protein